MEEEYEECEYIPPPPRKQPKLLRMREGYQGKEDKKWWNEERGRVHKAKRRHLCKDED